jgi:L-arabinose transport system ATP-binding protein
VLAGTELMRAVIARTDEKGRIIFGRQRIHNSSPKEAMKNGIVLVPEDRKMQGILAT